jgi:hypothetical protein
MAWALVASLLLLAGCPANNNSFTGHDGGRDGSLDGADGGGTCMAGQWTCAGGSEVAQQCNGRGGIIEGSQQDCRAMGRICADGFGCVVCTPGSRRCNPDNPQQTQQCAADGSAWEDGATCDESSGRTCNNGVCEDRCNPSQLSYLGCEYWPTVTANSQLDPVFNFAVVLANPQTYPVRAVISGGALGTPMVRTLMPGQVDTVTLPWVRELSQNGWDMTRGCSGRPCISSSTLRPNGAYHIETNGPIAAYQFNPLTYRAGAEYSYTNDASLLLPSRVLTRRYIVTTHENWQARDRLNNPLVTFGGFVAIVPVSGETETEVRVTLTAAISGGPGVAPAGPGVHTYRVPRGGVLQLVASQPGQDLTGTLIEATAPVAVFTGHDCTQMPDGRPACDHLEEQLFPNETWGRRYAVSQLRDRGTTERSRVRIITSRSNNQLTFDGIATPAACASPLRAPGSFCEFETGSSFVVSGTEPMLVMQYMIGQGEPAPQCNTPNPPNDPACMGDPAMVTEVPVDQFRSSYDFLVPDTYTRSFINVVVPNGAVRPDGTAAIVLTNAMGQRTPIAGTSTTAGGSHRVFFLPMMPGRYHIESESQEHRFGIKVYGVAPYTSYMYPGGLDLEAISPPG